MKELLRGIKGKRVLVFGDLMLDTYLEGTVDRISPEAPVPILKVEGRRSVPGGAANVAMNVLGLGATALLAGVVGDDPEAEDLTRFLESKRIECRAVIPSADRATTVKTRLIAHHQQVSRFDREDAKPLSVRETEELWSGIEILLEECDSVIVSDYAKGVVQKDLCMRLITKAKAGGKPVLVDPKGTDFTKYGGATLLTPNEKEAFAATGGDPDGNLDISEVGKEIISRTSVDSLLVTLGEKGMVLFESSDAPLFIGAHERNVFDVTGAGDTVIATLGAAFAAGSGARSAAELANLAAGIVVEKLGTTAITIEDLEDELSG